MNLLKKIKDNDLKKEFLTGNFGLEKEGLRVRLPANLASTDHPKSLGSHEDHPYIKTDYGESMPELITPPISPFTQAFSCLETLNYVLLTSLEEEEYMWPFSVPCLTQEDHDIKISQTENIDLNQYRLYTAAKYGKKRQLINGIHINYSFNKEFLKKLFEVQEEFSTLEKMSDELYLKFASNFLRYQWLLVYLFGASPVAEDNFFECPFFVGKPLPTGPMRSLRNSNYGFINNPEVSVRYHSIENYTEDLQTAVKKNLLRKEREYYGDIRLRGTAKESSSLLENGIQYIEIRSFDNNPYFSSGIDEATLQFIHLFFLIMMILPEKASPEQTIQGNRLKKEVAQEHPHSKTIHYDEGLELLSKMQEVVDVLGLEDSYSTLINQAIELLNHPEKTVAGKITTRLKAGENLVKIGEELGWKHKQEMISKDELPGYEHLSTADQQKLIHILQKGLETPFGSF